MLPSQLTVGTLECFLLNVPNHIPVTDSQIPQRHLHLKTKIKAGDQNKQWAHMTVSLPHSVNLSCSVIKKIKLCNLHGDTAGILRYFTSSQWFMELHLEKTQRFCNLFELLMLLEFLYNIYLYLVLYTWMGMGHDIQPLYSGNTVQQPLSPAGCFDAYSFHILVQNSHKELDQTLQHTWDLQ